MENNISEARRIYSLLHGKFTQKDAAQFFDVSLGTYCKWEQGAGKLNGEILCAIADKYGCSTDYLLRRTNNPAPYPTRAGGFVQDGRETRIVDAFRRCTPREKDSLIITAETMADGGQAKITPIMFIGRPSRKSF